MMELVARQSVAFERVNQFLIRHSRSRSRRGNGKSRGCINHQIADSVEPVEKMKKDGHHEHRQQKPRPANGGLWNQHQDATGNLAESDYEPNESRHMGS